MKKITLVLFMVLSSLGLYAQLDQEGFETWPVPGWTTFQNSTGPATWLNGQPATPLEGVNNSKSAYIASQNGGAGNPNPEDWLITKPFPVPANPRLQFFSKFIQGGDQGNRIDIRISTSPDPATFVSLIDADGWSESETNPQQQVWTEKELVIPTATFPVGTQVYVAFFYRSSNVTTERWIIDNVQVVSQCLDPANITITNVTPTTFQVNIGNTGGATNFSIEVLAPGDTQTGNPDFTFTGTSLVVNTGLTENTNYRVYVRANCGPTNFSGWIGPIETTTTPLGSTCNAPKVIPGIPYQTNDNTSIYGDDFDGSPGTTGCGTTAQFLNGNEVVYSYTPDFTGQVNIVMTNNGANSGMFVYTSCANIGTSCAAGGTGSAVLPVTINNFAVTAGQTYYIVIATSTTQTTPYTLTIQQATCEAPANTSITNVDFDSADLSWTNPSGATSWQYVVQPAGTGIPTTTSQINVANSNTNWPAGALDQATNYEYFVRADCGNGTFSPWAGPYTFTTTQIPVNLDYSEGFENPVTGWSLSNGTQTNKWVIGPAVNNGGNRSLYISNDNGASNAYTLTATSTVHAYRDYIVPANPFQLSLSFDWRSAGEGPTNDYFRVWSVPATFNPTPGAQITAAAGRVQIGPSFNLNNNWTTSTFTIDASAFTAGQTRRIIIEWRNNGTLGTQPPAAIDNINLKVITCSVPTGLAVTPGSVTASQAGIVWTAPAPGASSYDYFRSTTNTPPTDTTPPTGNVDTAGFTLQNLLPSTTYFFWVRSNCGTVNGTSFWVGPISFTTLQVPATLTYQDGFETNPQWTLVNGTQTNKWIISSAVNNGGTQSLYISDNGAAHNYSITSASVVHAYRDIQIPAGPLEQLSISFDWRALGEGTADRLRVYLVPGTFTPTAGTQIAASATNIRVGNTDYSGNNQWQNTFVILPNVGTLAGQVRRLVFEWRNDGAGGQQQPAAVDNINVAVITCPSPALSDLTLGTVTPTSAVVNWIAPASVTPTYDFYISTNISNVPGATTTPTGNVNATTVTLDDEIPAGSTNFYFWVRSNCGPGDAGVWTGPLPIGLPQVPTTLPYVDNIEGSIGWTAVNGTQANKWVVGSAISNSPTTSLYVSNNNGVTNTYTNTASSVTHIYRDITIPTGTTQVGLSFDWRAIGEGATDRLRVWLVPSTFNPTPGTQIAAGTDRRRIGGEFSNSAVWKNEVFVFNESQYVGQTRRLIFEWRNDGTGGNNPPAAVDNINFRVITCPAVTNLQSTGTANVGEVLLTWTPGGTETQWEVIIQPETNGPPSDTTPPTVTVNNTPSYAVTLPPGVIYEYYVRPVCGPNDKGFWAGPSQFSVFFPPACARVDLFDQDLQVINPGQDLSICPGEDACVDLTAQYLQTGNTTSYNVETIAYTPQFPFTGGIQMDITQDDRWAPPFTLPADFNFCFFGEKQTTVQVGSNGVVTFGTNFGTADACPWSYNTTIPNTGFPIRKAIYGVYQDIDPSIQNNFAVPSINYQILGTYPCRAFVVNFSEIAQFGGGCNDNPTVGPQTTQVVFYEITNIVEVYVKRRVPCTTWNGGRGLIGIQNAAGTVAFTPPNRNTGNWTAIEEAYRFTPNGPSNVQFEWLKDGVFYSSNPAIEVCVNGVTNMKARATYTGCGITPAVIESNVTITPVAPIILTQTNTVTRCVANPGDNATFNLLEGVANALPNPQDYTFTFYETEAQATAGNTADQLPTSYVSNVNKTLYVRVQLNGRTCFVTDSFDINIQQGPLFDLPGNFTLCQGSSAPIAISNANFNVNAPGITYTWTLDGNPLPDTGNTITASASGTYQVTVNNGGCSAVRSVAVTVITTPFPQQLPDVAVCESYVLPALDPGNNYFTGPNATGTQLTPGTVIESTQTIYINIQGAVPGCSNESDFVVTVYDQPVVTLPDGPVVNICATVGYILPTLLVGNYYDAPNGGGNMLSAGQVINTTQTIYVYATTVVPTINACFDEKSFVVNVLPAITADVKPNVTECDQFILEPLSANNNYYTGPGGTGTLLAAGTPVTQTQTIYIYTANGDCTDESSFTVTIIPKPVVTLPNGTIVNICSTGGYTLPVLSVGNYYTAPNGGGNMLAAGQVINTNQTIYIYAAATTPTISACFDEKSFVVNVLPAITADVKPNVAECGQFVLGTLSVNNSYYTGPGGTGTQLAVGTPITQTQTIYIYAVSGNCTDESSFTVTIVPRPVVTLPGNSQIDVCATNGYTLPVLSVGNYYTAPNGGGNMLAAGQVISTTQTIYVYAAATTPTISSCFDEKSFVVNVVPAITADIKPNVTRCEQFTLEPLSANNNYYTGPGGTGTQLAVGSSVTQNQTIYIYAVNGSCTNESSFTVTIIPRPEEVAISGGCEGNRYVLAVVFDAGEINYNPGNVAYAWSRTENGTVIGTEPTFVAESLGEYFVTISPLNSTTSCSTTARFDVTENSCLIQRGISPNNDGLNDS
ncbi:hypothetical protein CHU92_15500, partial [Flavobacterium cyanobacteriorum]